MESPKDILLAKWLNKSISDQEQIILAQEYDLEELDTILNKQTDFDLDVQDSSQLWESLKEKLVPSGIESEVTPKAKFPWIKVALGALTLLILGFGFKTWLGKKDNVISAPNAQIIKRVVADNTQFILSPGSMLDYNESSWDQNRDVNLKGHAYFDVQKGAEFTVRTTSGTVTVLGTQFEVWEKDGSMKVSCLEGKVAVVNLNGKQEIISKNESIYINQGLMGQISTHSLQKPEFLTARYNYEKISIVSLAEEVERYYDVDVTLDQINKKTYFSGVLILDDIDKACSYLAETLNLKYERMSSGITFSKN